MGYVVTGLAAALLLSWTTIFFMGKNINGLHEEIGVSTAAIELLVETNLKNYKTVKNLQQELQRCATMRASAEGKAREATEAVAGASKDSYLASDDRRDEISEQIKQSGNDCGPLPDRVTELLSEATSSANRAGGDS